MPRIFRRSDLDAMGLTPRKIGRLLKRGTLQHVSHGWYASNGADETLVLAARTHTRVGCLSAAQFHGLWVPKPRLGFDGKPHPIGTMTSYIPTRYGPPSEMHVLVNKHESSSEVRDRVRKVTGGRTKACVHRQQGDKGQLIASVEEAIEQVVRCHDWETALIVIESALHLKKVSEEWVLAMLERLPRTRAKKLHAFQLGSESGTETRVAHYLRSRGLQVRQQVALTPDIRVDALVGQSLVVESDSFEYHGSRDAYVKDRWRAGAIEKLGYNVVSLSYEQVWDYWNATTRMLNSLIDQRKHLRTVRDWFGD